MLHGYDVIHITLSNLENGVERISGVNGVTGPGDISEIVFLSLIEC